MKKICSNCNKEFTKAHNTSKATFAKQKFCGIKCSSQSRIGTTNPHSEEWNRKIGESNKNNKTGLENGKLTRFKKIELSAYDKVGGKNEYRNIHKWVEKELGKPEECSKCGKIAYGKQIHWANISKEYRKNISDWLRLCSKCHYELDVHRQILPINKY